MTVVLAIVSRRGAVVATDSARTEANCTQSTNTDKTFAVDDWLIGGFAGLLEFTAMSVPQHVVAALADGPYPLSGAVARLQDYFDHHLPLIAENENIAPEHRKIELLLIGREKLNKNVVAIRSVEFHNGRRFKTGMFQTFATTGDVPARSAIEAFVLPQLTKMGFAHVPTLEAIATQSVMAGIAASGIHPHCSSLRACAGHPCMRRMTT